MLRAAADLDVPMAGVRLAYRRSYFRQMLDSAGNQNESPVPRDPRVRLLEMMDGSASVIIEGRRT
jgi:glucan phosphorylase